MHQARAPAAPGSPQTPSSQEKDGKGVHQALDDFRWIAKDIAEQLTRLAELIPLTAAAEGHHDASGKGAGGAWFPADTLHLREGW